MDFKIKKINEWEYYNYYYNIFWFSLKKIFFSKKLLLIILPLLFFSLIFNILFIPYFTEPVLYSTTIIYVTLISYGVIFYSIRNSNLFSKRKENIKLYSIIYLVVLITNLFMFIIIYIFIQLLIISNISFISTLGRDNVNSGGYHGITESLNGIGPNGIGIWNFIYVFWLTITILMAMIMFMQLFVKKYRTYIFISVFYVLISIFIGGQLFPYFANAEFERLVIYNESTTEWYFYLELNNPNSNLGYYDLEKNILFIRPTNNWLNKKPGYSASFFVGIILNPTFGANILFSTMTRGYALHEWIDPENSKFIYGYIDLEGNNIIFETLPQVKLKIFSLTDPMWILILFMPYFWITFFTLTSVIISNQYFNKRE